jgi:hypothetical protein
MKVMDEPDPHVIEVLERLLRERYGRLADRQVSYQASVDRLEAARAAETETRRAWEQSRAALAAAEREMDEQRQELERLTRHADADLQRELTAAVSSLRRVK